ncbi:MAG TPA: MGMT family protein [Patescibacteria group bacterium]|jgi:methylated-DNA-protein-cysteine methyltransferase-like protein|nr:MGMT family protein [Patescibacteria group bacterium]
MNFKEQVYKAVGEIPKKKLVSYGQVAAVCGSPRAARQVGWMLRLLDGDNSVPWWRVINAAGEISIKGNLISTPLLQKAKIEAEGIPVSKDFKIDLEKYRYHYFPVSLSKNSAKKSPAKKLKK